MAFEWDEAKDRANIEKHGVSFEQAATIFEGPILSQQSERRGETRSLTLGLYQQVAVLAVIHTDREGRVRIISARPASRKERRLYHERIR